MQREKRRCPKCEEKAGVRIAYGYPTEETFAAAQRGELAIGGCMREIEAPKWECLACEHRWPISAELTPGTGT